MSDNLFEDFKAVSQQEWLEKISKDLKGKSVEDLKSITADGIEIDPVYHHPSQYYPEQNFRKANDWKVVQEIMVTDAKEANKLALEHLNRGASALLFYLSPNIDLKQLLDNILIEVVQLHFVTEGNGLEIWQQLQGIISKRNLKPEAIESTINIDCLENLARSGNWFKDENADFEELKNLYLQTPAHFKSICINTNLFANAGATLSQQLGIALSMAYEYFHRLEPKEASKFWFNFGIGSDYFGEIAKLRAFRRLWTNFLKELKIAETEATIYTETSLRNKTILDAYNNMVRTTSEAMAAVIGGCDELSIKAFNLTFEEPTPFGERIAKNQQSILEFESHLNKVQDMARGSYFIEELTENLAQKAWQFFKVIEY